ncbi:MAG: dicarboxylate/amino acid:cation symporter [Myxococcota bacterium]|nr:dicarboxylate/amino acid:cation symporter [Myxococcota bacterium]
MKIYTKILIGMAVGVTLGLTVGPKSSLLEHDLYPLKQASDHVLKLSKDGDFADDLPLPNVAIEFIATGESKKGQAKDLDGNNHEVKSWVKGTFKVTKHLLLVDKDNRLGAALTKAGFLEPKSKKTDGEDAFEKPKPGMVITAWLKLKQIPLKGLVQTTPIPVSHLGTQVISYLKPIGDLFMRLIKMVIVPLVFASLLVGIASLGDVRKLGRLGGKTLGLYFFTTAVAVSIGLLCAHVVNPGSFISESDQAALVAQFQAAAGSKASAAAAAPSTMENILNIVPLNPVNSLASGDMLQIIFSAVIFGIALTLMGDGKAEIIVTFFDRVQEAMVLIIHMVMSIAPFGVAALVADVIGSSGASLLIALGVYAGAVLLGLFLHAALVYGGLVVTVAKLKLSQFLRAIRPAQLIAFSTSSSSATLPVSMECAEENLGISNSVSSFVLPLGSTVNMDGTALYQGVAAIFIAQVFGMDLSLADQLTIVLTATMASIGAAGVPGAGMVTLAMVLTATGIPQVGIALILGMDRLLDMFRTAVNVTGDLAVTSVMAASEGERLQPLTGEQDVNNPERGFEGRLDRDEKAVEPSDG